MKRILLFIAMFSLLLTGCSKQSSVSAVSKNLNSYSLDISFLEPHKFNCKQIFTYKNTTEKVINKIKFALYVKAFEKDAKNKPVSDLNVKNAYPNGLSYGEIIINSIKHKNENIKPKYEGEDNYILVVELSKPLAKNEKTEIEFDYTVTIPNVNHRFGFGNNCINVANFYPIVGVFENGEFVCTPYNYNGDPFYSECSNYYVTISVPKEYTLASSGVINSVSKNEYNSLYKITALAVRDFAFVLSDKFKVLTKNVDNCKVNYFYYKDDNANLSLETGCKAIATFSKLFGKYPYEVFNVVQTNFVHGGMEFPNLVMISDNVLNCKDYQNVIIHETAHQWWYGLVGSNAYKYGWLDEGLTEFSTVLFYENNLDYDVNTKELIKNTTKSYCLFLELIEDVTGKADSSMNRDLGNYQTESEYVYISYLKGMLFYNNLRELVGTEKFLKTMKFYVKQNSYKNVTPNVMIEAFNKAIGKDVSAVANSWINGNVVIKNVA